MKKITVGVSDDAYKEARIWAAAHETSVSAIVQYCLQNLTNLSYTTACTMQIVQRRHEALAKNPAAQRLMAAAARNSRDPKAN
jgi:hypothetical protein